MSYQILCSDAAYRKGTVSQRFSLSPSDFKILSVLLLLLLKRNRFPPVFLGSGSLEAQKPLPPKPPLWLVVDPPIALSLQQDQSEILCKRISWMVAQTIARQLVSVVKTSI